MTISPEQIAANIAASQAHRRAARERDLAKREARRLEREVGRFPEYNGKLIAFVVKTRKDLYKPLIGRPFNSPGDHDSVVNVIGEHPAQESLEQALALFEPDRDKLVLILTKLVPTRGIMQHWLAPMLAAQDHG